MLKGWQLPAKSTYFTRCDWYEMEEVWNTERRNHQLCFLFFIPCFLSSVVQQTWDMTFFSYSELKGSVLLKNLFVKGTTLPYLYLLNCKNLELPTANHVVIVVYFITNTWAHLDGFCFFMGGGVTFTTYLRSNYTHDYLQFFWYTCQSLHNLGPAYNILEIFLKTAVSCESFISLECSISSVWRVFANTVPFQPENDPSLVGVPRYGTACYSLATSLTLSWTRPSVTVEQGKHFTVDLRMKY